MKLTRYLRLILIRLGISFISCTMRYNQYLSQKSRAVACSIIGGMAYSHIRVVVTIFFLSAHFSVRKDQSIRWQMKRKRKAISRCVALPAILPLLSHYDVSIILYHDWVLVLNDVRRDISNFIMSPKHRWMFRKETRKYLYIISLKMKNSLLENLPSRDYLVVIFLWKLK